MEQAFLDGIQLFNSQQYFEAHEALEALWLKTTGDRKAFLHGLIQLAAAFHHYTRGNSAGFRSLLEKGSWKLQIFGAEFEGIDIAAFTRQLQRWREHVQSPSLPSPQPPTLPQIQFIDGPHHL